MNNKKRKRQKQKQNKKYTMKLTVSGTSCSVTVVMSRFVARAIERSLGVGADCIDITVVGVECTFIHI